MSELVVDVAVRRGSLALEAAVLAEPGITVLFGDSGSGKTTLLHAVLGAVRPWRGTIRLDDRTLFDAADRIDLPTHRRRVGIVFQDAALFPHLDVFGNVAFGTPRRDDGRRARALLDRVGARDLAERRPAELSGGQRQRVSLARTLAAQPEAVLLDEPFSSLDAGARRDLGAVVRDLADSTGVPFVLVTHDLFEAVRLGDSMTVVERGRTRALGSPEELVSRHGSILSRALGSDNLFAARIVRHRPDDGYSIADLGDVLVDVPLLPEPPGARVALVLPAGDVIVCREPPGPTSARNTLAGRVERIEHHGGSATVHVTTPAPIRATVTAEAVRELGLVHGDDVHLLVKVASFRCGT